MTRADNAVKLLTRIRLEKPDLWQQIRAFALSQDPDLWPATAGVTAEQIEKTQ
jgi:hypothetical protein